MMNFVTRNLQGRLYGLCGIILSLLAILIAYSSYDVNGNNNVVTTTTGSSSFHTSSANNININTKNNNKTLLCIVGSVRTFGLRQAYESIYDNVYMSLGGSNNVDVNFVFVYHDHTNDSPGANMRGAQTCYNDTALRYAIDMFSPKSVRVLDRSNCNEFENVWWNNNSTTTSSIGNGDNAGNTRTYPRCTDHAFFLQIANIDQCFNDGVSGDYDNYVRVRPDSFFVSPVHPVVEEYYSSSRKNQKQQIESKSQSTIVTWPKYDSPGSDQFFIMSKQMYQSWWEEYVFKKLLMDDESLLHNPGEKNISPEYTLFSPPLSPQLQHHGYNNNNNNIQVEQNVNIEGCILRSPTTVSCWRRPYLNPFKRLRHMSGPTPDDYITNKLLNYPQKDTYCNTKMQPLSTKNKLY